MLLIVQRLTALESKISGAASNAPEVHLSVFFCAWMHDMVGRNGTLGVPEIRSR